MNAELIEDLGMLYPTEKSKKKSHYGIFICSQCRIEFKSTFQSMKKNSGICRSCAGKNRIPKSKHGKSGTRVYNTYKNMIARCYNEKASNYSYYGGRGITVCDEWRKSKAAFFSWADANGYSESLTIDRRDNDKGYSPDNCRWMTPSDQTANQNVRSDNTSTVTGVSWCSLVGKWKVRVQYEGIEKRLGFFDTLEDSVECRRDFILANNLPHKL